MWGRHARQTFGEASRFMTSKILKATL